MEQKKMSGLAITILLLMFVFAHLLGCGDVDNETVTERLRFAEFFLFPTAPYINKSYREHVPDEEVAIREIDFEAEVAEIQKVYRDFIGAYAAENMSALTRTLDTATSLEWKDLDRTSHSWGTARVSVRSSWSVMDCADQVANWEEWELTDFYIRPAYVMRPWMEASARGPMFFTIIGEAFCTRGLASFYLTKKSRGLTETSAKWRIHQIDGSRYFTDPKYKVPPPRD